jgi:hypothetical protein
MCLTEVDRLRRGWGSTYAALAHGQLDTEQQPPDVSK